jgi:hypothetical protein
LGTVKWKINLFLTTAAKSKNKLMISCGKTGELPRGSDDYYGNKI